MCLVVIAVVVWLILLVLFWPLALLIAFTVMLWFFGGAIIAAIVGFLRLLIAVIQAFVIGIAALVALLFRRRK